MLRMLEAQAPAKQTVTDTISTLSARLNNATLLEDRRAAILGLRSFAKEYPASVASGALRGLISSLNKDSEDVDTTKSVLETLLMLFNPNENSPEASDDIALWLADEFSQRQDNITILLDLLETNDFYSRLYSLQLISAVSSARPVRTQECILSAPLGTTRLVAILDDPRDAVRNAGLLLLIEITQASPELQKLVAFENAFDRVFRLIEAEGSLAQGGIIVQDCLSLLANLLRFNLSNQSLFRETGYITKFAELLHSPAGPSKAGLEGSQVDDLPNAQLEKNLWGLLAVLRIFLIKGSLGTPASQVAFHKHKLPHLILSMAFGSKYSVRIRAEALYTCADMIRGNSKLQEEFAQYKVTPPAQSRPAMNGKAQVNGDTQVYVIDGLLDLVLAVSSSSMFDLRFAACECIMAYFFNHVQIQLHFLHRAIDGHKSGLDETSNFLSALLDAPQGPKSTDPYKIWFASVLAFHLIFEDPDAKGLLMSVSEGNADNGEEVVSCIQVIAANLLGSLERGEDERVSIAYLMLLCGWLFEDQTAVNDFLGEGSTVQSLVQLVNKLSSDRAVIKGLCALLLGILYEFSTKDSPIPRRTLQPVLLSGLGRERYLDALTVLRQHPLIRDFEVLFQTQTRNHAIGSPEVYFDSTFVDFLKDNFSRLIRAVDRDPNLEVKQTHDAVDRDLVDTLRAQIEDKTQSLLKAESELLSIRGKLDQELAERRRHQETSAAEFNRIKNINEALQKNHELEHRRLEEAGRVKLLEVEEHYRQQMDKVRSQQQQAQAQAAQKENQIREEQKQAMDKMVASSQEYERRWRQAEKQFLNSEATISELERRLDKASKDLSAANDLATEAQESVKQQTLQINELSSKCQTQEDVMTQMKHEAEQIRIRLQDQEWVVRSAKDKLVKAEEEIKQKEEERGSAQSELDDMLIVLADLEEKRAKDKKRLKSLGEEVSDMEEDGEGSEDEYANGDKDENEDGDVESHESDEDNA